jgi:hypothetical protein
VSSATVAVVTDSPYFVSESTGSTADRTARGTSGNARSSVGEGAADADTGASETTSQNSFEKNAASVCWTS